MTSPGFHDEAVALARLIAGDTDNPPAPNVVLLIDLALQAAYQDGWDATARMQRARGGPATWMTISAEATSAIPTEGPGLGVGCCPGFRELTSSATRSVTDRLCSLNGMVRPCF
jgi:hypothetical protein